MPPGDLGFEERTQFGLQALGVGKGIMLGPVLDEKVEGIDHRHVGEQIDGDGYLPRGFRKRHPRNEVAIGILLPMNEVFVRFDFQ